MNNGKPIYLDFQASTPIDQKVLLEMQPYFTDTFANPHASDHAMGWKSAVAVDKAAQEVADLIGCDRDEVIFTSGATESNNLALFGLARRAAILKSPKKRILLGATEHKCVLSVGRILQEQYNFIVNYIPVDNKGRILFSELDRLLDDDVLLVSIMAVNNEIGTIQDLEKLSAKICDTGALLHCDAAQAPIAMDTQSLATLADLISLSGHKIYGPKGVGALYIRREIQTDIEPLIYGGSQQNGLRSGTIPTPLCVGMGAAASLLRSNEVREKRKKLKASRDRLTRLLMNMPCKTTLHGDIDNRHPGNLSIGFQGLNAQDILGALQPHLAASTGSACTSGIPEPSHVLRAIGLNRDEANSVIRFSLGFETTDQEIEQSVELIKSVIQQILLI